MGFDPPRDPGEIASKVGAVRRGRDSDCEQGFGLEPAAEALGQAAHLGGVAPRLATLEELLVTRLNSSDFVFPLPKRIGSVILAEFGE